MNASKDVSVRVVTVALTVYAFHVASVSNAHREKNTQTVEILAWNDAIELQFTVRSSAKRDVSVLLGFRESADNAFLMNSVLNAARTKSTNSVGITAWKNVAVITAQLISYAVEVATARRVSNETGRFAFPKHSVLLNAKDPMKSTPLAAMTAPTYVLIQFACVLRSATVDASVRRGTVA